MSILRLLENNPRIYCFECPHCGLMTEVETNQLNCRIFRHGGRSTFDPFNPHLSQQESERLVGAKGIYGCGKPFRVGDDMVARPCGWI